MNKMYLVKEVYDYEKSLIVGVCPNRKLAEMLKQKNENFWNLKDCEITSERWDEMLMHVYCKGTPNEQSLEEAMIETYPEYSVSDIARSYKEYMNRSYTGTVIEEINLYANNSDIALYGINYRTSSEG